MSNEEEIQSEVEPVQESQAEATPEIQPDSNEILNSLKNIQEKLDRPQVQAPISQPIPQTPEVSDEELMFSDPKAYSQRLTERIKADVTRQIENQSAGRAVKDRLIREFPELDNPTSAFYKEVDSEVNRRVASGYPASPQLVEDVAYALDRKRLLANRSTSTTPARVKPTGEASSPTAAVLGSGNTGNSGNLSSGQKTVLKALNKDDKWGSDAFTKFSSRKEAVYERKK